uniref:Birch protein n=1 Tax=Betula platyphylla TaxID=78630 RepID=A0A9E9L813_BETPL|nr:birch protein [Betula platyphylla]
MAAFSATSASPPALLCFSSASHSHHNQSSLFQSWRAGVFKLRWLKPFSSTTSMDWKRRRNLIYAASQDAEEAFKKTVEVDRLIDTLRNANPIEKDYEELATSVMSIVDRLVHKTKEKIESSTDVLKEILKPVVDEVEEVIWPPRDPEVLKLMEREVEQREQEGQLDEGFLSEVNAQLRQAKEDVDKPGLEAMLQKVLQLYASIVLAKRSYAKKVPSDVSGAGEEVLKAEQFLEVIIKAPEEEWNKLLINGMTVGKGEISPEEFYAVIKKRIERTLIRTEGGSYQQRVLTEYLKGIQSRGEEIVQVLQGKP